MVRKSLFSFLLEGFLNYCAFNGVVPHIVVNANHKDVVVPRGSVVKNTGTIRLNLDASSVRNLQFGDAGISFSTRFSGKDTYIYAPYETILFWTDKSGDPAIVFINNEAVKFGPAETSNPLHRDYNPDNVQGVITYAQPSHGVTVVGSDDNVIVHTYGADSSVDTKEPAATPVRQRPQLRIVK